MKQTVRKHYLKVFMSIMEDVIIFVKNSTDKKLDFKSKKAYMTEN